MAGALNAGSAWVAVHVVYDALVDAVGAFDVYVAEAAVAAAERMDGWRGHTDAAAGDALQMADVGAYTVAEG